MPAVVLLSPGPCNGSQGCGIPLEQGGDGLGHGLRRGPVCQLADGLVHQFGNAAGGHADHGQAAGHGLQRDQAEGFAVIGMDEGVAAGQQARHFPRLAHIVEEGGIVLRAASLTRMDQQQVILVSQKIHGLQQDVHVLLPRRSTGKDQQPGIRTEAQLLAQPIRVPAGRAEQLGIHAERLHMDVGDSRRVQPVGNMPGRGHHPVEAAEQTGPAPADRRLGPAAQMQGGQRRGIGVAEAHHGDTQPIAGVQRGMARAIGIPGLDQVGLQADQQLRPAPGRGGPAIAVPEGQAHGGHGLGALAVVAGAVARNHEGMADLRAILRHPGPLGQKIALHAPGAGRKQHRRIHEVRRATAGSCHGIVPARLDLAVRRSSTGRHVRIKTPLQNQDGPPSSVVPPTAGGGL